MMWGALRLRKVETSEPELERQSDFDRMVGLAQPQAEEHSRHLIDGRAPMGPLALFYRASLLWGDSWATALHVD